LVVSLPKAAPDVNRRSFVLALTTAPLIGASNKERKAKRLACNSWPFRAYFDTPQMHRYRDPAFPLVAQAQFPEFLADQFNIHNVEFLPQHFPDTEPATIQAVKAGLAKANSVCCNLMGLDRKTFTDQTDLWAGVASELASASITVALTGGPVTASELAPAVGKCNQRGIRILFHNDDVRRESAQILTTLIQQLGPTHTGACPDFGNFAPQSAAFALDQLRMLAPYAHGICHAKDGIAEKGVFHADDFAASMKVMHDAGFRGLYSLEFEGLGPPVEGVRALMELTEEYLS
jgi:hypothetical protein